MKKIKPVLFSTLFIFACSLVGCSKQTVDPTTVFTMEEFSSSSLEITGLTEYGKTLSEVTIPKTINGKDVISIKERAFFDCDNLVSVNLSVKYIEEYAFADCNNLQIVKLNSDISRKIIAPTAFIDTAFYNNEENWDNDVLYIGNVLYKAKSTLLGDYIVKSETDTISDNAFYDCKNIITITIPPTVSHIGVAFWDCSSLTNIIVEDNNVGSYRSIDGNLYLDSLGGHFCLYATGKSNDTFVVPSDSIEYIDSYAFYKATSLKKVSISSGITYIGYAAFRECKQLIEVVIPTSVTKITPTAFLYCNNLTTINYAGSETDWNNIKNIDELALNENTVINFNYVSDGIA